MPRRDANDYGTTAVKSKKMHRPAILANHILHWISSLIVMSIAAYFISDYTHNTHLIYWVTVAAVDTLIYIPALVLPASRKYKGYMWPVSWIFSYLWLTAFIFAAQDYNYGLGCSGNSPKLVNKCSLKRTLEAFAFIAFFTNLVGTLLEARLHDIQQLKPGHDPHDDKDAPRHAADRTPVAPPGV